MRSITKSKSLIFTLLLGCLLCSAHEEQETQVQNLVTGETTNFSHLYQKGLIVMYINPDMENFNSCAVQDSGHRLKEVYTDKQFITIINTSDLGYARKLATYYEGLFVGEVFLDQSGILKKKYNSGTPATLLFVERNGSLVAMIPASIPSRAILKTLHRLTSIL